MGRNEEMVMQGIYIGNEKRVQRIGVYPPAKQSKGKGQVGKMEGQLEPYP